MREIKFDVILWDGEDVKTIEHYTLEQAIAEDFIAFKDGAMILVDSSVIIREYTGLKDATKWEQLTPKEQADWLKVGKTQEQWSGREIYEGDIIDIKAGESGVFRYQVLWDGKQCGWRNQYGQKLPQLFGKPNSKNIGNIYENPALLNQINSNNTE